jgi:lipid-A-disaccharide synthase
LDTAEEGFVLFLGGDLGHAALLGKRLHLPVYAYTERDARHEEDFRLFFVPSERVADRVEKKGVRPDQVRIVGDLMLDAVKPDRTTEEMYSLFGMEQDEQILNLFPGSRPSEVEQSLPFFLHAALLVKREQPKLRMVLTLAPFITMEHVQRFLQKAEGLAFTLEEKNAEYALLRVESEELMLYRGCSYNTMQITTLAISLPGTNNVELAAMGAPTLVILPLNWPALIPLPGIVGIIGQVPLLGSFLKKWIVIPKLLPKFPQVSPVNRTAGEMIFPEQVGVLAPEDVALRAFAILNHELTEIREKLATWKKEEKASERIISLIREDLPSSPQNKRGSI